MNPIRKKWVVGNIMQALCQPRTPLCSDTWQYSSSFSLPSSVQGKKQKKRTTWLLYSWGSGDFFFLLVLTVNWAEGGTLWSAVEWVSWGQCARVYFIFPTLLFSCIACSVSFSNGDRLHSPALISTWHLWCWNSTQRISIEQSECESGFCPNSTSRLT